eukprot:g7722.t1
MTDVLRAACDFCKQKKVRCVASVSGAKCVNCTKRKLACIFGTRQKTGPKRVERGGGSRSKSIDRRGRTSASRVSSGAGRGASAAAKPTSGTVGGIVSSGGDGTAVSRPPMSSSFMGQAVGVVRAAAAAGSLEDVGVNGDGGGGAGLWWSNVDGGNGGAEAAISNVTRVSPLAFGLDENSRATEVECAARPSPSNFTHRASFAAGVGPRMVPSFLSYNLPAFPPFIGESGGGEPEGLMGTRGSGGRVVSGESGEPQAGEKFSEKFSDPVCTVEGGGTPCSGPGLMGGGAAQPACRNGGGGGTANGSSSAHGSLFSLRLGEGSGDQPARMALDLPGGALFRCPESEAAAAWASLGGGDAGAVSRMQAPAVVTDYGGHGGGCSDGDPNCSKAGNGLAFGAGGGATSTDQAQTLRHKYSARAGAAGVGRVDNASGAHTGGGSPALPFGPNARPAPVVGDHEGKFNADDDTRAAVSIRGGDGGGTVLAGLHSSTVYGGETAVPLPFASGGGGCRGDPAPASRGGRRTLGTTGTGPSFFEGFSCFAEEHGRTAMRTCRPSPADRPSGSHGGGGGSGGGKGGSFRGFASTVPSEEDNLEWMIGIFDEVYAGEQQQQQQQQQQQWERKRKAGQQPDAESEPRYPRPVDAPIKRRKKVDHPALTTARAERVTAARATAMCTPVLAATMPLQPHQQPALAPPSFPVSDSGGGGDVSPPLFGSLSFVGLAGGGRAGGGGFEVGARGVAPGLFGGVGRVGSGGGQGHGDGFLQPAEVSQAGDSNDTSYGRNGNSTNGAAGREEPGSGDDLASQVDWESMYGPRGSFIGSLPPTLGVGVST